MELCRTVGFLPELGGRALGAHMCVHATPALCHIDKGRVELGEKFWGSLSRMSKNRVCWTPLELHVEADSGLLAEHMFLFSLLPYSLLFPLHSWPALKRLQMSPSLGI